MTIAARAAAAKPEETAGLLAELYHATYPGTHADLSGLKDEVKEPDEARVIRWRFRDFMRWGAHLDAAMMLIPDDHPKWAVTGRNSATIGRKSSEDTNVSVLDWSFAATPALALIAAIAASKGL